MRLGEMAHRLESAIEQIDVETVTVDQVEPLLASFDNLEANFQTLSAHAGQDPSAGVEAEAVQGFVEPVARLNPCRLKAVQVLPQPLPAVRLPAPSQLAPLRVAANQSVRVRAVARSLGQPGG